MSKTVKIVKSKSTTTAPVATPAAATTTKAVAKVVPPAPKPEPTPEPAAKVAPKAKTPAASINRGVTTGLPVMTFQDQTILANNTNKLTDMALLTAWRKEFPNAKGAWVTNDANGLAIVAVVRRFVNLGRHGAQKAFIVPGKPIHCWDADGQIIVEKPRTRRAKAEDTDDVEDAA